jgi:predicted nucleic acid-binding protein
MKRRKLYLDTCLLVAVYRKTDTHHKNAIKFCEKITKTKGVDLVCSHFTITEFTQVCVNNNYFSEKETYEIANSLLITSRIDKKYSYQMIDAKGRDKKYKLRFFP